jgi:hypothetical protein
MIETDVNSDGLIEKILELSKQKKIIWEYLDEFENLYKHLNVAPKKRKIGNALPLSDVAETMASTLYMNTFFDANESFYAKIRENFIVLLRYMEKNEENVLVADRIKFMLVPRTFKNIKIIEEDDKILRLHNYVKTQFPDVEDIINDIFKLE